MASQQDLDQGGTHRQWTRTYLGPSVGWVYLPASNFLSVTAVGTTTLNRSTSLIFVNVNADGVVIQLASSLRSVAGSQAIPYQSARYPVTIADVGGFAGAHLIHILPFGTETIDGLAAIDLASNYGAIVLNPLIDTGGWTLTQS